jgi:hypothetical protein
MLELSHDGLVDLASSVRPQDLSPTGFVGRKDG